MTSFAEFITSFRELRPLTVTPSTGNQRRHGAPRPLQRQYDWASKTGDGASRPATRETVAPDSRPYGITASAKPPFSSPYRSLARSL